MGRPRKVNVEREPNGRPKRSPVVVDDKGNERAQIRRAILANGADPALTWTAVGVMYCQYMRSDERKLGFERYHYDAALRYQYVHNSLFGVPFATAQKLESCIGHAKAGDFSPRVSAMGDETAAGIVADYRSVSGGNGTGFGCFTDREEKNMYESVVVYDHLPPWVGGSGAVHDKLLRDFIDVADAVAMALGYGNKR